MRISITVDVDPSEYPQAHALIEALRTVTADVTVNAKGTPRAGGAPGRSPPPPPPQGSRDRGSPASSAGGTVSSRGTTPAPAAAVPTPGTDTARQAASRGAGTEADGAGPGFAAGFPTQTGSGTSGHSGGSGGSGSGSGSGGGSAGGSASATITSMLAPALEPGHALAGVQGFYRDTLMAIRDVSANIPELIHGINVDFADNGVATAGPNTARFGLFFRHLCSAMFEQGVSGPLHSVTPFITALTFLTPELQETTRTCLTKWVLQFLTQRRPIDCNRRELFLPAEAFALLIKFKFVKIDGALQTISTLIATTQTRCAGLTMLGKTIEVALPLMQDVALLEPLQRLVTMCQSVQEPAFEYDVNYCSRNLSWLVEVLEAELDGDDNQDSHSQAHARAVPAGRDGGVTPVPSGAGAVAPTGPGVAGGAGMGAGAGAGAVTPTGARVDTRTTGALAADDVGAMWLEPLGKLEGAKSAVYGMAYDNSFDELVTGGKGGDIIAWSATGDKKQVLRFPCPDHFVAALDIHPSTSDLFVCGTSWGGASGGGPSVRTAPSGAVAHFKRAFGSGGGAGGVAGAEPGAWRLVGTRQEPLDCLLSVKCLTLPGSAPGARILTAESSKGSHNVVMYDVSKAPLALTKPLWVGSDHTDIVTSLATVHGSWQFASGSHDTTVALWDARMAHSVGRTTADSGGHVKMVSCVDMDDTTLVSSSSDGTVALWDTRKLSQTCISKITIGDHEPVMQVAIGPTRLKVAVAATANVYLIDFETGTCSAAAAASVGLAEQEQYRNRRYHVLRWKTPDRNTLFAGGTHVDIFKPVTGGTVTSPTRGATPVAAHSHGGGPGDGGAGQ